MPVTVKGQVPSRSPSRDRLGLRRAARSISRSVAAWPGILRHAEAPPQLPDRFRRLRRSCDGRAVDRRDHGDDRAARHRSSWSTPTSSVDIAEPRPAAGLNGRSEQLGGSRGDGGPASSTPWSSPRSRSASATWPSRGLLADAEVAWCRSRARRCSRPARPSTPIGAAAAPGPACCLTSSSGPMPRRAGLRLLTRDVARYRTYFPTLRLIAP